jgi:hypothetical protein
LIEADMQELYGIDVWEPGLLESHPSRWLTLRIRGLAMPGVPSRLARVLFPNSRAD